eukprot:Ihof_evm8s277 gene=Ihof_evmTU8s277
MAALLTRPNSGHVATTTTTTPLELSDDEPPVGSLNESVYSDTRELNDTIG